LEITIPLHVLQGQNTGDKFEMLRMCPVIALKAIQAARVTHLMHSQRQQMACLS